MKRPYKITPIWVIDEILKRNKKTPEQMWDMMETMVDQYDNLAAIKTPEDLLEILRLAIDSQTDLMPDDNLEAWLELNQDLADQVGMSELVSIMRWGTEYEL